MPRDVRVLHGLVQRQVAQGAHGVQGRDGPQRKHLPVVLAYRPQDRRSAAVHLGPVAAAASSPSGSRRTHRASVRQ